MCIFICISLYTHLYCPSLASGLAGSATAFWSEGSDRGTLRGTARRGNFEGSDVADFVGISCSMGPRKR